MAKTRYARVMAVYLIGLIMIIAGVYIFLEGSSPEMMSNSFYLMLAGLAVAVVGSSYGRRRIHNPRFKEAIEHDKKKGDLKRLEKVRKRAEKRIGKGRKAEPKYGPEKVAPAQSQPYKPAYQPYQPYAAPSQPVAAPTTGVIKIVICPHCGEENKSDAMFCDKCGRRLRPR